MTTIQKHRILGRLAIAAVLATCVAAPALADNGPAPTLNITSPTAASIVYLSSFPATVPVNFTVTMNGTSELKFVSEVNVTVDEASLYGSATGVNAFGNGNACTEVVTSGARTCNATSAQHAALSVPWSVPGVGTYTIVASAKYRGELGYDEEAVQVSTFSAEYPAPPAVANAYINGMGKSWASAKQRGCIIGQIAEGHAQYEAYGPKGGPYNTTAIHAAVESFAAGCPR
jgi:hypothetical protein